MNRIMVVEDNPSISKLFCTVLESAGYEVLHASDAYAAILILKAHNWDVQVILVDMVLPGRSGYDFVKEVREGHKELIIIAVTALSMPEDRKRAIDAGCNAFVIKPVRMADLVEYVRAYISNGENDHEP